jgi:hypothetical protein
MVWLRKENKKKEKQPIAARHSTSVAFCPGNRKSDQDRSQARRGEWLKTDWRFADRR